MSATLDLYLAPTGALGPPDLTSLADLLDADERDRAARLPAGDARRDFVAAHALARLALSRHRPALAPRAWRFEAGPDGKPAPVGMGNIAFNLSHGAGLVAVAIGVGAEVGVDVEPLSAEADLERTAPVFCTHEERVALSVMEPADRRSALLALWTLKESLLKAAGRGFSLSPLAISCQFAPLELVRGPWEPPPHAVVARLAGEASGALPVRGFQVAACALRAFPSEVGTGSREGNALNQRDGSLQCFHETLKRSRPEPPLLRVHGVERLAGDFAVSSCPPLAAAFVPVARAAG